ncbi:RNA polymerase sigma factor [Planococcus sp. YIM B11945]|uniref:RNA polymerase sigma factor n=1 Tax=Planococcus sp. YIM B11945 TaxID=3435410 RepID=UPI003D7D51E6
MSNQDTVENWYDDYGNAVFTYILMMVGHYQQAEDLTQETFVKAFRKQEQFLHQSSTKTWLFSIAQNTTKDYFRKKNPLKHYFDLSLNEKDTQFSPQQLVELGEQEAAVFHSLQKLKLSYRQVIVLRMIKEFSTKETSEVLGWSESKVKSTLSRALSEMKNELVNGGFEYEAIIR